MRILYLMHVDWRWIKQRPHFLAEELSRNHKLLVVHRWNPKHLKMPRNFSRVRLRPFLPIPRDIGALSAAAKAIQRAWVGTLARRFAPQAVWLTFPTLIDYVPDIPRVPLIYDCMDDAPSFCALPRDTDRMIELERRVVHRASRVLCSSHNLLERLQTRTNLDGKAQLVRNALSEAWIDMADAPADDRRSAGSTIDIAYFGTISEWLDFDAVLACLDRLPQLRLHLIGPTPTLKSFSHPQITWHGSVQHDQLRRLARRFAAFVMPFKITPLIEGVDPVKLYEYLACGRPVLSSYYAEVARFEPYIHFYKTRDELLALMQRLAERNLPMKASREQTRAFMAANTWSARGSAIEAILRDISGTARDE